MGFKPPYSFIGSKRGKGINGLYVLGGIAAVLVIAGLYLTIRWVNAGGIGSISFLASDTPTPTNTLTPSNTPTITITPSITATFTEAPTGTASAPFLYTVQLDDTLSGIAERFGVDFIIIMALNGLDNDSVLFVNQELIIPDPNTGLPDPTALPEGLGRGDEIDYLVLPGDTLAIIAEKFLSTEDAIIEANELDNPNEIFIGQILKVPVELVTRTPGPSPTATEPASERTPTATESGEAVTSTATP